MSRTTWTGLLAVMTILGFLSPAAAIEKVTRRSTEKSVSGEVTDISVDQVTVKTRSNTVEIPASDVESIKWTGEPASLNVARGDEQEGRFEKALKSYQEAFTNAKSDQPGLKADLEFGIASINAKLALAGSGDSAAAIAELEKFRQENPKSYRYYETLELLGRLYAQQQDWAKAGETYGLLEKSKSQEYKMAAKIGAAEIMLIKDGGDLEKAEAEFDAVLNMQVASPGEKIRQLDARFGKVNALIQKQQFEEAQGILDQIVTDTTITENSTLAHAFILLGKCHMAAGKPKLAVLNFLQVDLLYLENKPAHAEALFHLTRLWTEVGEPIRAEKARKRLETLFPESRWTKQLNQL